MNGCAACFRDEGPIPLTPDTDAYGQCDFCGEHGTSVWDVTVWSDHFSRVLEMYELSDGGSPLHERFQADWDVFSFADSETVLAFMQAVLGGPGKNTLLDSGAPVKPQYAEEGAAADHGSRWAEFRRELIEENRYFPAADFDIEYLKELIRENVKTLRAGLQLYRARGVGVGQRLTASDLGVPPARKVRGGRGNPVGIAHLYLAKDVDTCMRECRAEFNGDVAVGTFELAGDVSFLDLADLSPENPFRLEETRTMVQQLVAKDLLAEFGRDLSVPTRPGENELEYVPTQFLCELVKSLGIGGIRYRSSLRAEGWNIVLFEPTVATLTGYVRHFHVTDLTLSYEEVES